MLFPPFDAVDRFVSGGVGAGLEAVSGCTGSVIRCLLLCAAGLTSSDAGVIISEDGAVTGDLDLGESNVLKL